MADYSRCAGQRWQGPSPADRATLSKKSKGWKTAVALKDKLWSTIEHDAITVDGETNVVSRYVRIDFGPRNLGTGHIRLKELEVRPTNGLSSTP